MNNSSRNQRLILNSALESGRRPPPEKKKITSHTKGNRRPEESAG